MVDVGDWACVDESSGESLVCGEVVFEWLAVTSNQWFIVK